ncbi:MAG: gliding motility-associated C-terminal domain-containing protein [Bacteroidota bacterium]
MNLLYKSILFFLFFYTFFPLPALSQKQTNTWYFGDSAGIDFNSCIPVALTDGSLSTYEGCATISDTNGNLLFYTNGVIVFDASHDTMPNGTGLMGHSSSTQSAIIVQQPGSDSLYYIFTAEEAANSNGLRYSIVDMSLNGGLGDVIVSSKNILLYTPSTEKLTAVKHANDSDIWIVTHEFNTDSFYAYLLTDTGLFAPVISSIGTKCTGKPGELKISPNGKKIAMAIYNMSLAELYDFDNETGILTNPLTLPMSTFVDGISFSPDNSKLYVGATLTSTIFQYNLLAGDTSAIKASKDTVGISAGPDIGSLQIGPDGKIYVARWTDDYLGVINNPNALGVACNYVDDGFYLGGKNSYLGLPNFIQSYFKASDFTTDYDTGCAESPVAFNSNAPFTATSWSWNFGDTVSANNTDTVQNPVHIYSDTGSYNVTLIISGTCLADTIIKTIYVKPNMITINLGNDTTICYGDFVTLDAVNAGSFYLWSTGNTTQTIIADTGTYYVEVTDNSCLKTDTIIVSQFSEIVVNLGNDTVVCKGDSIIFDAGNSGASYLWSTGDTTQILTVDSAGTYFAEVFKNGCIGSDTININQLPEILVNLGNDTSICVSDFFILDAENIGSTYLWSTGDTIQTIVADSAGIYFVEVFKNGCSGLDTISISQLPEISVQLGNDTLICVNTSVILDAGNVGSAYQWSTGETSQIIIADSAGSYIVEVFKGSCSNSDTIIISQFSGISANLGNDITINLGSSAVLPGTVAGGVTYLWSSPAELSCINCQNPLASPEETTTYILTVTDTNGCISTDSITINVNIKAVIFIPDIFSPNGDGSNDMLYVRGKKIESINFAIYDRWGEKVFETTDINNGWDGNFRGKPMNPAVFVYYVTGNFTNGDVINEKGHVALIR